MSPLASSIYCRKEPFIYLSINLANISVCVWVCGCLPFPDAKKEHLYLYLPLSHFFYCTKKLFMSLPTYSAIYLSICQPAPVLILPSPPTFASKLLPLLLKKIFLPIEMSIYLSACLFLIPKWSLTTHMLLGNSFCSHTPQPLLQLHASAGREQ